MPIDSLDGALCTFGLSVILGYVAAIKGVIKALKSGRRFVVLDAKLFEGRAQVMNPLIGLIFRHTTSWDCEEDIIGAVREISKEMELEKFSAGHNYLIAATKPS